MRKTFTEIVLNRVWITQAQLARRLGWQPARVGYLCSPECRGFPFAEMWHLKECLGISDNEWVSIEREYFTQDTGDGKEDTTTRRSRNSL